MSFKPTELTKQLAPFRLRYVATTRSTNDLAARMRREGKLFAPAVVLTSSQTRGRGRGPNRWCSDPGTLTVTFALPVDEAHPPHHLPLLAGLAVRDACQSLLGPTPAVELKWPNDLLIEGKKLAGLLCERVENVDLVGIGINVSTRLTRFPKDVQSRATTLELAAKSTRSLTPTDALLAVAHYLKLATTDREPFQAVLRRYDTHHHLVGKRVTIRTSPDETYRGICKGLDAQGRLLLKGTDKTERFISGSVEEWG